MTNEPERMPVRPWRPQISLVAALLLMTIVGMAIVIVQLWKKVEPLESEVRALRTEVGHLTIDDDTRIQAIGVPTDDAESRRYRIFIPRGEVVFIHCQVGTVPKDGIPEGGRGVPLEPGEHVVSLTFYRDELSGTWNYRFGIPTATVRGKIPDEEFWPRWNRYQHDTQGIGPLPLTLPNFRPNYVLQRHRVSRRDSPHPKSTTEPLPGFVIWLDRK
jgi:hypothetical protein